jgi:pyrroloquinoline quinone biosynthesis protein B
VFSLTTHYPAYVSAQRSASLRPEEALLGLLLESSSGKRLAYVPAVPVIDEALLQRLDSADLLLFDGTFWSDDELIRVKGSGATAREMGHVPVSSADGSLRKLAHLGRPRKVFIHINNTNPMLDEASPQYREVRDAGWEIAEDKSSFEL